jgi:hypothetical protein
MPVMPDAALFATRSYDHLPLQNLKCDTDHTNKSAPAWVNFT